MFDLEASFYNHDLAPCSSRDLVTDAEPEQWFRWLSIKLEKRHVLRTLAPLNDEEQVTAPVTSALIWGISSRKT
jgi:hypothetical protein